MNIYLVRHGEAAASWDQDRDPGLSDRGHAQAKSLADNLASRLVPNTKLRSSPLKRAQQTAAPLAQVLGTTVRIDNAFREVPSPASLDDRNAWLKATMKRHWPDQPQELQQWRKEIMTALKSLHEDTVIFTHFVVINAVTSFLTGKTETTCCYPDYISVTILKNDNGALSVIETGAQMITHIN